MNFYKNLKGETTTMGSSQASEMGLSAQFEDLTIGDPDA
jgi:hypothetical protein